MGGETFNSFSQFAGRRAANNPELERACDVLDDLPCTDLLSLLTVASQTRSEDVTNQSVIDGNRFHKPSEVSQRDFHWIESVIHSSVGQDVNFVELSPLQPFGINKQLAKTNQKNVVSTLRRSEANADATTALFRIAIQKHESESDPGKVRLATNTRTVRAQSFDDSSNFLPHFKVFGQVSVGLQSEEYGANELETIVEHLGTETDIIDKLSTSERSGIDKIDIQIGNISLLSDLIDRGMVDPSEARYNTANPDYNFIEQNGLDIPEYVTLGSENLSKELQELGFRKGVRVTEKIKRTIDELRPDILPRVKLHLGRVAGIGYYRHACYKISASNAEGVQLPIADGGSTNWAAQVTGNKQLYTVTSGMGTELICQYLLSS